LYHSGIAQTLRYITLLLFARRQDRQCNGDVILRGVCAESGGFEVFEKSLKMALLLGYGKIHCLLEMPQLWYCAEISHWL